MSSHAEVAMSGTRDLLVPFMLLKLTFLAIACPEMPIEGLILNHSLHPSLHEVHG